MVAIKSFTSNLSSIIPSFHTATKSTETSVITNESYTK